MAVPQGYVILLLHAHLPFVRHPEHPEFLEEDWLYEAISETYLPLLRLLEELEVARVPAALALTLTPPLCEMLADPLLKSRYLRRVRRLAELAEREAARTGGTPFHAAALMYRDHFRDCLERFEKRCGSDLIQAFRHYQDCGMLEILTSSATHAVLPLMVTAESVRAQVEIGVRNHSKHFGRRPRGFWQPECAYLPGLDAHLRAAGLEYFFLDTHGLAFGTPRPRHGPYRPVLCPSGISAFARDPESSKQVWSSRDGYPGDFQYREFYRDLGYDAEYAYIRPYLHADGVRRNVGFKYHRITGRVGLHEKQPYDPVAARERAAVHAGNFLFNRRHQVRWLRKVMGAPPVVVAPYDAELFGHWWFEGPQFLSFLLRKAAYDQDEFEFITPGGFLARQPRQQALEPAGSSWGDRGYFEVWLNGANDWVYRHLHVAEVKMRELACRFPIPTPLQERALKQAARELLLAQSSDWAFMLTGGAMAAYAEKRTRDHLHRFHGLYLQLTENRLEEPWIAELEKLDNIFSEIDYRVYAGL